MPSRTPAGSERRRSASCKLIENKNIYNGKGESKMTEAVLTQKDTPLPLQRPDMTAVAERALTWALELCAKRMRLDGPQAAAHRVRQGDAVARMHCCSSIAKQVAASLGSSEQNVRAIYAPDYDGSFQDLCSGKGIADESMVHLLVWTQRRTPALDSLVTDWDRALARVCRDTFGTQERTPLLDVRVIADADVEKHFDSGWNKRAPMRLAAYMLWTTNQVVDVAYARGDVWKEAS
jgi:hypothetical protein